MLAFFDGSVEVTSLDNVTDAVEGKFRDRECF